MLLVSLFVFHVLPDRWHPVSWPYLLHLVCCLVCCSSHLVCYWSDLICYCWSVALSVAVLQLEMELFSCRLSSHISPATSMWTSLVDVCLIQQIVGVLIASTRLPVPRFLILPSTLSGPISIVNNCVWSDVGSSLHVRLYLKTKFVFWICCRKWCILYVPIDVFILLTVTISVHLECNVL